MSELQKGGLYFLSTPSGDPPTPEPIIDVHLHAMLLEDSDPPNEHFCLEYLTHAPTIDPVKQHLLPTLAEWRQDPDCPIVVEPAESDEANMARTIEVLCERNMIGLAIEMVESSRVLTDLQKRDLLYNNAVRFFRINTDGSID